MENSLDGNSGNYFQASSWQLLIELPLTSSRAKSSQPGFDKVIDILQSLGLPQVQVVQIQAELLQSVQQAAQKVSQVQDATVVTIRLFMMKKVAGEAHQAAGWGYFLSERSLPDPGNDRKHPQQLIEMFLYQEGS